jgi:hypothetical protein
MATDWFYCNNVTQTYEVIEHIPWVDTDDYFPIKHANGMFLSLSAPLLHIANSVVNDVKMKTYFLNLSDFQIKGLPDIISGVEVEINMNRGGRITDETIQLMYNGAFIGENRANFDLSPDKLYGSNTDLWGTVLTSAILSSSTFGIGVRFQSHPSWPHSEYPRIDYIRIRVH